MSEFHPHPIFSSAPRLLGVPKRRRALSLAAAAAALSLAGCAASGPQAAAPLSPEQADAEKRVKTYQSDIEGALDKVDRERLRAAAEKKPPAAIVPIIANGGTAPATPAGTMPATVSSQVILASAASSGGLAGAPATAVPPFKVAPDSAPPQAAVAAASTPAAHANLAVPTAAPDGTPALPMAVSPAMSGVVVAMSGEPSTISSAVITPFTPPNTPAASAMGSMTAMVTPAQFAVAEPPAAAAPAEESLDGAMEVLRKSVGAHPTLNTALALALLDGTQGHDGLATGAGGGGGAGEALKKLPDADQKVLADLLAALEAMKARPAGATLAERTAPLVEATRHWQQDADLSLPRMVLATRVDSFGVFTPISATFEQGKRHTVIIYCEVANFLAKKGDDGWYTTKLSQQETLITDDGLLVWRPNAEEVEDRSLNQRHDFYLVKKLTIPETLAAGKYTLRMSVTDRNTNKISLVSMPVEVVVK